MKKRLTLVSLVSIVLCLSCHSAVGAEGYDYFNNIRYPATRRPDVALDKINQQGGPDAVGYNKRVVHWWPKKGVDSVDVPEGVEARTWTVRTAELEPLVEAGFYAKWWPVDLRGKKQFKAHLIGFRGIGSKEGDPFTDEALVRAQGKGICPSVILRLEDGRKRCFSRGSFSDEDQEYILNLYEKEMARIHETLEPPPEKHREEITPAGRSVNSMRPAPTVRRASALLYRPDLKSLMTVFRARGSIPGVKLMRPAIARTHSGYSKTTGPTMNTAAT